MATQLEVNIKAAIDTAQSAKNVQQLRKSIKELNSLGLQLGSDQREAFKKIATAVGDAQDRVEDLRDEFVAFKGSAVEKLTGSFNLLQEGLVNLDFDKVKGQLKNLGTVISANPLLFLAKVIIELVNNLDELEKAGGLVGDVFKFVGDVIDEAISLFKDLTDAIGLTAFAAEEAAERIRNANEKQAESIQRRYDAEIEYAKAAGKETTDLEIKKQKAILESNKVAILAIERRRAAEGELSEDEQKELDELIKSTEDAYKTINILNIQRTTDAAKKAEERRKKETKEVKRTYEDIDRLRSIFEIDRAKQEEERAKERLLKETEAQFDGVAEIERVREIAKQSAFKISSEADIARSRELIEREIADETEKQEALKALELNAFAFRTQQAAMFAETAKQAAIVIANELKAINDQQIKDIEASVAKDDEATEKQIANLNKRKDANLITQSQLDIEESKLAAQRQQREIKAAKEVAKLKRKQFNLDKALAVGDLSIQLAKVIALAAAQYSVPATIPLAINSTLQAGIIGAQLALVASKKPPAFARGGIVTGAGTGTSDSITARLSNGESVINANSTQAFAPLLSAINELGGGRSFLPDSNNATAGTTSGNTQPIIKTYVVESEITNSQKNANKTKRLTSI